MLFWHCEEIISWERSKQGNFGAVEGWWYVTLLRVSSGTLHVWVLGASRFIHGDFLWETESLTSNFMFLKPIVSKSHQGNYFIQNLLQNFTKLSLNILYYDYLFLLSFFPIKYNCFKEPCFHLFCFSCLALWLVGDGVQKASCLVHVWLSKSPCKYLSKFCVLVYFFSCLFILLFFFVSIKISQIQF